ncbi:MAG: DNA-processing protein DprA [Deltaproteobacteria bacterium]|nr:DNA-processing protein DprA [Deltaproteobacteria bacterium]
MRQAPRQVDLDLDRQPIDSVHRARHHRSQHGKMAYQLDSQTINTYDRRMAGAVTGWAAWIALRRVAGIGNVLAVALVRAFGSPEGVFGATDLALQRAGVRREVRGALRAFDRWREVDAQLARLDRNNGRLVTWTDASYPDQLRHIHDPPLFLYALGELIEADRYAVALVGSRDASAYGRQMAAQLGEGLATRGITIVSGMARGIDAAAHAAALRAGGRTIAVLGSGIDVVYPSEHHRLHMQITKNGAVVSEYPMGAPPDAENFPGRNRIISGLALATVVIEATERSGSLITAQYAVEQGREVFAVPGPVGARSRGTHQLIRQGAALAENADDVLREIAPHLRGGGRPAAPILGAIEAAVLAELDETPRAVDELLTRTGLAAGALLETLLLLELRGLVRQLPGQLFARGGAVAAVN